MFLITWLLGGTVPSKRTIKQYEYKSPPLSLFERLFLDKFWTALPGTIYPPWLAPNVITLAGLVCIIVAIALVLHHSPALDGERNHVRREPGRVNGPGQRGPEPVEEEALEEREGRALVFVLFYGTLAGDGAAEEPRDEEHGVPLSGCVDWRFVAAYCPGAGVTPCCCN